MVRGALGTAEDRAQIEARLGDLSDLAPLLTPFLAFDWPDNERTAALEDDSRAPTRNELVARLLTRVAAGRPLVLALEDAHWFDSSSWGLLRRVLQAVPQLLLVLTTRPPGEGEPAPERAELLQAADTQHLVLDALTPDEVDRLVARQIGAPPPDALSRFLRDKAAGHPFFTTELLHALQDTGTVRTTDGEARLTRALDEDALGFPATIDGVVTSRIDQLAPSAQRCVKVASIIGRVFPFVLLASLTQAHADEADDLRAVLDALESQALVEQESPEPDLAHAFRHVLTQEVIYEHILFEQRQKLHRAVAEWYEDRYADDLARFFPLLAHHWDRAEDASKAAVYLERSAARALAQGAYREAVRYAEQAIARDPASDAERTAARHKLISDAAFHQGLLVEARHHAERAVQLHGAPVSRSTFQGAMGALRELLTQLWHRWGPTPAKADGADGARLAWIANAYNDMSPIYYLGSALPQMIQVLVGALNLAERSDAERIRIEATGNMTLVVGPMGLTGAAQRYLDRAVTDAQALGDPVTLSRVRTITGIYLAGSGRTVEAIDALNEAFELHRDIARTRRFEVTGGIYGWTLAMHGDLDDSLEVWSQCHQSSVQRGDSQSQVLCALGQIEALLQLDHPGHADRAHALLDEARSLVEPGTDAVADLQLEVHTGTLHLREGALDAAHDRLIAGAEIHARTPPMAGYAVLGFARLLRAWTDLLEARPTLEVREGLRDVMRHYRGYARNFGAAVPTLTLARARLDVHDGREERAHKRLRLARDQAAAMDHRREQAWASLLLGGDDGLRAAEDLYAALDMHRGVAHVHARRHGLERHRGGNPA